LFGRNSLGGNIALTSALPRGEYDGGVALIYGNYDRVKAEGFVNVPIAEGLAFRVAGAIERHDPHYKSTVNDRASVGDLSYQFVRASLRFAPAGMDDRLEMVVRGSYYNQDDRGLGSFNAKNIGAIIDPSLVRQPGQSVTFNGVTYPFPFGYNGGNYATGVLVPFSPVFRDGVPDIGGADVGIPIGGPYTVLFDFPAENRVKGKNASAVINFGLTDDIRLRSITGYTDFFYSNRADGDGGPIPIREFYFITKAKTFTQEFQIQSANSTSPLQYTFGAFYMDDKVGEGSGSVFSNTNYRTIDAPGNGYPVLYADGGGCGYVFNPLNAPSSCNLNNTISNDSATPVRARTKSYAGYGQVSYTIADKLTLTGGARYTVDDKEYRQAAQPGGTFSTSVANFVAARNAAAIAAGQPAPFTNPAGIVPSCRSTPAAQTRTSSAAAALRASLELRVRTRSLEQSRTCSSRAAARASSSTGTTGLPRTISSRPITWSTQLLDRRAFGRFGASFAPTSVPQGTFATFDAERVRAFELGTKNTFFDRRLQVNAAVFYNRYYDNQVQGTQFVATGPNTGVNVATIANVGDTIAPGAELSIIAKPVSRLTLRGGINYLHARNTVAPLGIFGSGLCTISTGPTSPCGAPGSQERIRNQAGLGSGFFPNPQTNPELFVPLRNSAGVITGTIPCSRRKDAGAKHARLVGYLRGF
jgi:iron complex outermembrane receptor protein